jgi:hypothetical protein
VNITLAQIAGILAALAGVFWLFVRLGRRGGKLSRHPYQKQTALFSADGQAFLPPLKQAVAGEYEIRVGDILVPKKDASDPLAEQYFDFVLCDKKSLAVVCAIQLRESPPPSPESDLLQAACESLGLPFLCFRAHAAHSAEAIREKLREAMAKAPLPLAEPDGRKEPRISSLDGMKF